MLDPRNLRPIPTPFPVPGLYECLKLFAEVAPELAETLAASFDVLYDEEARDTALLTAMPPATRAFWQFTHEKMMWCSQLSNQGGITTELPVKAQTKNRSNQQIRSWRRSCSELLMRDLPRPTLRGTSGHLAQLLFSVCLCKPSCSFEVACLCSKGMMGPFCVPGSSACSMSCCVRRPPKGCLVLPGWSQKEGFGSCPRRLALHHDR